MKQFTFLVILVLVMTLSAVAQCKMSDRNNWEARNARTAIATMTELARQLPPIAAEYRAGMEEAKKAQNYIGAGLLKQLADSIDEGEAGQGTVS